MPSLRMLYWYCMVTEMGKKVATPFTKLARLIRRKKTPKVPVTMEHKDQTASQSLKKRSKQSNGTNPKMRVQPGSQTRRQSRNLSKAGNKRKMMSKGKANR